MILKKSLDSVFDKFIILTKTAPNDNAKSISVQCVRGANYTHHIRRLVPTTTVYILDLPSLNPVNDFSVCVLDSQSFNNGSSQITLWFWHNKFFNPLGNVHKGFFGDLWRYLPTYVLYSMYYLSMYYVRFSLTYLPTPKSDILYGRSLGFKLQNSKVQ